MKGTILPTVEIKVQRLHGDINPTRRKHGGGYSLGETADLRLPSLNLLPQLQGVIVPSLVFCTRTTELRMPGTAEEARSALQITQSGAVM